MPRVFPPGCSDWIRPNRRMTAPGLPRTSAPRCAAPMLAAGKTRPANDDVDVFADLEHRRTHPFASLTAPRLLAQGRSVRQGSRNSRSAPSLSFRVAPRPKKYRTSRHANARLPQPGDAHASSAPSATSRFQARSNKRVNFQFASSVRLRFAGDRDEDESDRNATV